MISEHLKSLYLFQKTPSSPCGTFLFRTKATYFRHIQRLVSISVDYMLGGAVYHQYFLLKHFPVLYLIDIIVS